MNLTAVEIFDYKSIRHSNRIEIGDVTCLVGKNESGKTALLQAIYALNPIVPEDAKYDETLDYPRSELEEYRQKVETDGIEPGVVATATYELDSTERAEIEAAFGEGALKADKLELSRDYANRLRPSLLVNEDVIVQALIADSDLSHEVKQEAAKWKTLRDLTAFLDSKGDEYASAAREAREKANELPDGEPKKKALADAAQLEAPPSLADLKSRIAPIVECGLAQHIWESHLRDRVPKLLYFSEYYQMTGQVNIEELKKRKSEGRLQDSDRPMLGLIELARLNLDQLLAPGRTEELIANLEGASNHLSKQILKYWSQNQHLQVKFDVRPGRPNDPSGMTSGMNLWGRVYDAVHQVSTPLGTRSRGFIWFFSFLAWFSQQKKRGEQIVLLLDEPGLFLHAKAQGDLLRYVEQELQPHHQVIYTTHSPFMVDPHHFERVRIVEDRSMDTQAQLSVDQAGTKVFDDVLEADEGSLFPLQGALGYDISQSLFVGPNSLIVEGVSDLLYLQVMCEVLRENGRTTLSDKWTITPVGGADKVPTFVALLGAQRKMKLATLLDIQDKDRQRIEQLYKRKLLRKKNVLTFGDFTGKENADIEDMFDVDFYLTLVNAEFKSDLTKPINESDLATRNERIVVRLADHFKANPLKSGAFNHYRPARYLAERVSERASEISVPTLDRFEKMAKALNALI